MLNKLYKVLMTQKLTTNLRMISNMSRRPGVSSVHNNGNKTLSTAVYQGMAVPAADSFNQSCPRRSTVSQHGMFSSSSTSFTLFLFIYLFIWFPAKLLSHCLTLPPFPPFHN